MKPKIAIVLPCHNPRLGWEQIVVNSYKEISGKISKAFDVALRIVDDGSSKAISNKVIDYIKSECENFTFIKNEQNKGKGYALRSAIKNLDSDYIIYTDYDFPYSIENICDAIKLLNQDKINIVVGVRNFSYYKSLPLKRKIISAFLFLVNHIFLPSIFVKDTQSGLKGFDQRGKEIFLMTSIDTFLFDTEFIKLASQKKELKKAKLKIQLRESVIFSKMGNDILKRELLNYFKLIFKK